MNNLIGKILFGFLCLTIPQIITGIYLTNNSYAPEELFFFSMLFSFLMYLLFLTFKKDNS